MITINNFEEYQHKAGAEDTQGADPDEYRAVLMNLCDVLLPGWRNEEDRV